LSSDPRGTWDYPVPTESGDYTTINLAAGVRLGHWDLQMHIQNLTDCSAATYVSQDVEYPSAYRRESATCLRANETAVEEDITTVAMSP
jgi:outer membrane receptor protein involved in Fe transport